MCRFRTVALCAAGLFLLGPAGSDAAVQIQFDMNGLTADAGGAFDGISHTGTISISKSSTGDMSDILIDGASHAVASPMTSITASIELLNGQVDGGSLEVLMSDGATYMAMIEPGSGEVNIQPGAGFSINGETLGGVFSDLVESAEFAGVDVTPWVDAEPLIGSFRLFAFGPDGSGVDSDTNLDVFTRVPAPGAAGLAIVACASAGLRRRRAAG